MPTGSLGKHRALELYSLAKPSSQKRDRDPNEIEYEKNCEKCTFKPKIQESKITKSENLNDIEFVAKNIDKTIERLKKGYELRK